MKSYVLFLGVLLMTASTILGQTGLNAHSSHLSTQAFLSLAERCAPGVPSDTLLAIARTESGLSVDALSLNRPQSAARQAGYREAKLVLGSQPKNRDEAIRWMRWFEKHHYTVSIGLMQVNSEMAALASIPPQQLFEPCTNIRVGAQILLAAYTAQASELGEGFAALDKALSLYNSGSPRMGFDNGYVAAVYAHAARASMTGEQ
jgi:type IV secretion system protein VirB1